MSYVTDTDAKLRKVKDAQGALLTAMAEFIDCANAACALPAGELKTSYTFQLSRAISDVCELREKIKQLN